MIVSEIIDELKSSDVLGTCDQATIFRRLTDAVSLISNQGILDPSIGVMSICVCDGCVTLPMEVEQVLAVNQGGLPTLMRDQWFQYHANGPGDQCYTPWNYTQHMGEVSTFKDPSAPVKLVAEIESALDSNKEIRVFGWDENGKRIYSTNSSGLLQDGFLVPAVYGFLAPNPSVPNIARIDRVQKVLTNGFVRLLAINDDSTPHTLIGYYRPEETTPRYTRIKVANQNWLKIKYRKRNLEVRSVNDWINIDNREVLILAVKAVNYRRKNQIDLARQLEAEAIRILNNEADAKRPPGVTPPQVIFNDGIPASQRDTLFY